MKILLAIDDSACSNAAADAVIRQFRPRETEVRVLHVDEWPKGLPTSMQFAGGVSAADALCSLHETLRRKNKSLVADVARQLEDTGFSARTELRAGDASHEILDAAAEWQPDVIVMGSHGRRGFNRLVLGSVSDHVVRHADCSVEVIRTAVDASQQNTT
ncbi:MAG TPA: universal stress protein [Vicinamibacterales bacterium]|jgi:nucleotide-binding universal stress UspA family protein